MPQVYALMHNGKGDFMIAFKNTLGYFFHIQGGSGSIIPKGIALNGAHNWAIPGGKLQVQSYVQGAMDEFWEETGIKLEPKGLTPNTFMGSGFYGVYFNVEDNFQALCTQAQSNVELGRQAASAVVAGTYIAGQYDLLMAAFQGCPQDNELFEVESWNFRTSIDKINRIGHNPATNWYYQILENLALDIYGVIVKDEEGLMVALGTQVEINPSMINVDQFSYDPMRLLTQGSYSIHTKTNTYHQVGFQSVVDTTGYFVQQG